MNNSRSHLMLLIIAYLLYNPSLPSWAVFGLSMMVCVGMFGMMLSYWMQDATIKAWFNRYF